MLQAQHLASIANPALGYNMYEVQKKLLDAWKITDIDKILPDPKGPNAPPPFKPPKVQEIEIKVQGRLKEVQANLMFKLKELEAQAAVNQANIDQLKAKAMLELEQADSLQTGHSLEAVNQMLRSYEVGPSR